MKACRSSKTYKGLRPPRCNGGQPCDKCREIYAAKQGQRAKNPD